MSLLDKIKEMFRGRSGEAEQAIKDARSTRDLMERLDELITRNEVELRKVRQDLARLELAERASAENIRGGGMGEREKEFTLLQIKRSRTQMENLKLRADILNKNIELHLNLVGKIQAMEAMDLRGIEQNLVERVMLDFEEGMENFRESVHAGEGMTRARHEVLSVSDREDLKALEKEILGPEKPASVEPEDISLEEIEREIKGREKSSRDSGEPPENEAGRGEPELE